MCYLIMILLLFRCSIQGPSKKQPVEEVKLPKIGKKIMLWATYYDTKDYKNISNGIPLRDKTGRKLGPKLSNKDICDLMMQGSGYIDNQVYGWGGMTNDHIVKCASKHISGRLKFIKSKCIKGKMNKCLTPFKSIAVDPKVIPLGTELFIPSLKGINGHDGYVVAEDIGRAITGNHIDFYIGKNKIGEFEKVVKSHKNETFEAYIR